MTERPARKTGRRPRLRTILLAVNLLILLLPLGGIAALRLFENELIRATEAQLLVQGALVRESFAGEYRRALASPPIPPGVAASSAEAQRPLDLPRVLVPRLDIAREPVLPPPPPAAIATVSPDPTAVQAGASITPEIEAAARETLAGIRVVDRNGIVVATTGAEAGESLTTREEVRRALAGERVSSLRRRISDEPDPALESVSRGQRYRVFVALPVEHEGVVVGTVVLSRTPMDIAKALYLNRRPLLAGGAAVLLVVVLVSGLTAVTIVRPARALIAEADRLARGERRDESWRVEPGTHEMARLSEAIATMADTLERRAESIRTLATHVSHEFKTPIATIRATVELLRDHLPTMSPTERERFIGIIDESSARLQRLLQRLLELARADALDPGAASSNVGRGLARAVESQRAAGLEVALAIAEDVGAVRMAEDTLVEVVANLLDNSRVHGGPGVKARVDATLERGVGPPMVQLTVADDGPGISAGNATRIFTPFFTTARERGGSGLGLSIVRALLAAHGGTIQWEPAQTGGRFVVRVPAADG